MDTAIRRPQPPIPNPQPPLAIEPTNPKDFVLHKPTWCPGCGDFAVVNGIHHALASLGHRPDEVAIMAGIGCSGKISEYIRSHGFHTLHGRTLPVATGIKLANRRLTVVAMGGDGDGYGIGLSHFVHTGRRNVDLTYVVMDNQVYGNTKGQTAPTSPQGFVSGSTPYGAAEQPIRPLPLALAAGIGYVAQGWSGDAKQLARLMAEGIRHPGFAVINVISPCVTFDKAHTYPWWRERVHNLDQDPTHDPADLARALQLAADPELIPVGLLYRVERPSFEDRLPDFPASPIVAQPLARPPDEWRAVMRAEFGTSDE